MLFGGDEDEVEKMTLENYYSIFVVYVVIIALAALILIVEKIVAS